MYELTDMFCGCGGSTEGATNVAGVKVKYALNHWKLAVESHNTNHPDTHHDCADISETHPARYTRTDGLIASPECTNHSLAKGNRRKNLNQGDFFQQTAIDPSAVRSRATMWDVPRFAEVHNYNFVIVENVVDVRYWVMFDAWLKAMHALGYKHKCVYLNAMHAHGEGITGFAPQSRDRIYIVFWKKGNPEPDLNIRPKAPCRNCGTVEAFQSWKKGKVAGKYGKMGQYIYRCSLCNDEVTPFYYAALNALDLSLPMVRIGDREKLGLQPLKPKTIQRIEYGINKYGLRPLLLNQRYGSGPRVKAPEWEVSDTQVGRLGDYLFSPFTVDLSHSQSKHPNIKSIYEPLPTQTTAETFGVLLNEGFMPKLYGNSKAQGLAEPLGTVTAGGRNFGVLLSPAAILTMRGDRNFSGLNGPLPTQVACGIQNYLISAEPSVSGYNRTALPKSPLDVMPSILTKDQISYTENRGALNVEDCYFRMLQPAETARAQGFPQDYVILGTKENQQRQIGNANPPPTMELLVSRCKESLERGASR